MPGTNFPRGFRLEFETNEVSDSCSEAFWAENTTIQIHEARRTGNSSYRCTRAGTTASSGDDPTGTGTSIVDGGVRWSNIDLEIVPNQTHTIEYQYFYVNDSSGFIQFWFDHKFILQVNAQTAELATDELAVFRIGDDYNASENDPTLQTQSIYADNIITKKGLGNLFNIGAEGNRYIGNAHIWSDGTVRAMPE